LPPPVKVKSAPSNNSLSQTKETPSRWLSLPMSRKNPTSSPRGPAPLTLQSALPAEEPLPEETPGGDKFTHGGTPRDAASTPGGHSPSRRDSPTSHTGEAPGGTLESASTRPEGSQSPDKSPPGPRPCGTSTTTASEQTSAALTLVK
jgi:hypothetical protein